MWYCGCAPGKVFFRPLPHEDGPIVRRADPLAEIDSRTLDVAEVMVGTDAKAMLRQTLNRE